MTDNNSMKNSDRSPASDDTSSHSSWTRNTIPECSIEFSHPILKERERMVRDAFLENGIHFIPNYAKIIRFICQTDGDTLERNVEYTKNRIWLDTWTDYNEVTRAHWRTYGLKKKGKVYSHVPYVTTAEAKALQLWMKRPGYDYDLFVRSTGDPPASKYVITLQRLANDEMNNKN